MYVAARTGARVVIPVGGPPGEGGFQSLRLQTHYDNKRGTGLYDSSGINIYRTESLRTHDLGGFQIGDGASNILWATLGTIPEGLSRYDFYCPPLATAHLSAPIDVVTMQLHMHITGTRMQMRTFNSSGKEKTLPLTTEYYDFNYQDYKQEASYDLNNMRPIVQIHPGDSFYTSCWFDNRNAPEGRKVGNLATHKWGIGSDDEMCTVFGNYLLTSETQRFDCAPHAQFIGGALKGAQQSVHQFTGRKFGEDAHAPPTCTDTPGFTHPNIGTCADFDRKMCELHGWEEGSMGSAHDNCCVCKSVMPPTCTDQSYHLMGRAKAGALLLWNQGSGVTDSCSVFIPNMADQSIDCDYEWNSFDWRMWAMIPDGAITLAGVCPMACGLCDGVIAAAPAAEGMPMGVLIAAIAGGVAALVAIVALAKYAMVVKKATFSKMTSPRDGGHEMAKTKV